MTLSGLLEILVTLAVVVAAAIPLGRYIAVFTNRRTRLSRALDPVESAIYRLAGVDANAEQT
jgi:K+-transporting ATPase ATPase A chain